MVFTGSFDEKTWFVLYLTFCVWRNLNTKNFSQMATDSWANSFLVNGAVVYTLVLALLTFVQNDPTSDLLLLAQR